MKSITLPARLCVLLPVYYIFPYLKILWYARSQELFSATFVVER